jgi:hypothetical protein
LGLAMLTKATNESVTGFANSESPAQQLFSSHPVFTYEPARSASNFMDAKTQKRIKVASWIFQKKARLFAALIFGTGCLAGPIAHPVLARDITLEDHSLSIAFDSHSGALTRLTDKTTRWKIERRQELGISFRLFAPLPERRWNPVLGPRQSTAEVKKISEHQICLQWKNLISENGGTLPITLTATVTLTNSELIFEAALKNDSALTVETIDYPYFGDFNPPSRETTNLAAWTMQHTNFVSDEIYPHFRNEKGYWGVFWPTKILDANLSPFCLIQSSNKGVYVAVETNDSPQALRYTFEQHPGVLSSITSLVPPGDEISGQPVHLEFRVCHLIFQKPHSTMKLAPVVLRCYQGDQRAGSAIYQQHSTLAQ